MKRFTLLMCVATALLITTSCKKVIENTVNNPATDFQLKLTRTTAAGVISNQYESALNMPGAANFTAGYFEKTNLVQLQIGGNQVNTVVPRLYANVYFRFTGTVAQVPGTYRFPADNNRVEFALAEYNNAVTHVQSFPATGELQVTYNETTKTLSGTVSNISFAHTLNDQYASEMLNGKFSNVGLAK